ALGQLPAQAPHAGARHRAPPQRTPQLGVRRAPERRDRRAVEERARQPWAPRGVRLRRLRVPRTDFLTDVAAVGMPPEALALIDRDAALQLDRQVRQAARRV